MRSKSHFLLLILLIVGGYTNAQFSIYGLNRSESSSQNTRIKNANDTLDLPFRDDFATSLFQVSAEKWVESENVFVDPSIGINPPNIHVASMDGLKNNGDPYRPEGGLGEGDILTSKPIRLGGLSKSDSVYLSFYWELTGLGESPENTDRLVLQFKSEDDMWNDILTIDANTPKPNLFYQQAFINLYTEYFYDTFQFRFVTYCDLNGRFDVWNLDYIYLDKDRSSLNKGIRDSGLASYPGPIFKNYYSVPLLQLQEAPEKFLNTFGNSIRFQSLKGTQPNANYLFSSYIIDQDSQFVISEPHQDQAFTSSNYIYNISLEGIDPQSIADYTLDANIDSLNINWKTFSIDNNQDYFDNDTVNARYLLQNYYALDDGTAEFAGGAKANGAQVAMKYGIASPGHRITHIDICFVNYEGAATPISLDLIVWNRGSNGLPNQELSRTPVILARKGPINSFSSYVLDQFTLIEEDTIFIGYEHREDADVFIGIDRNTSFGHFLYSKTAEQSETAWQKNTNRGTPMIHPRFDERLITGIEDHSVKMAPIYPNPTKGLIFLPSGAKILSIHNMLGAKVNASFTDSEKVAIDLSAFSKGIYVINYIFEGKTHTQKIVKE